MFSPCWAIQGKMTRTRGSPMTMWLIAKQEGQFVVREIGFVPALGAVEWGKGFAYSIETARSMVGPGAVRIPRDEEDDPRIVETWKLG